MVLTGLVEGMGSSYCHHSGGNPMSTHAGNTLPTSFPTLKYVSSDKFALLLNRQLLFHLGPGLRAVDTAINKIVTQPPRSSQYIGGDK